MPVKEDCRTEQLGMQRTDITADMVETLIVSYRMPGEVAACLHSLDAMDAYPAFSIRICENGGPEAWDALCSALAAPDGPCEAMGDEAAIPAGHSFRRIAAMRLRSSGRKVLVGDAPCNLGYAGGVNSWLRVLLDSSHWSSVWVLNPDTAPEPQALRELVDYAARHDRDMVGSRLSPTSRPDLVHSRGLVWRKWRASTLAVDLYAPAALSLPPDDVERRIDAPSGASMYVTRRCIERIGLMDERYFLYFEDLEWGLRAKRHGAIGYAHQSIIAHQGGTTIGTSTSRMDQSQLAVYLEFRNRLLFVRSHFALWLPWTLLMEFAEVTLYVRARAFRNMLAAIRGIVAGLAGETGRPDKIMRTHLAAAKADVS